MCIHALINNTNTNQCHPIVQSVPEKKPNPRKKQSNFDGIKMLQPPPGRTNSFSFSHRAIVRGRRRAQDARRKRATPLWPKTAKSAKQAKPINVVIKICAIFYTCVANTTQTINHPERKRQFGLPVSGLDVGPSRFRQGTVACFFYLVSQSSTLRENSLCIGISQV